jgi:ATP-dependent DNA helicase DinG
LKGRSNYACLAKVDELEDRSLQSQLLKEFDAVEGHSGEIEAIQLELTPVEKASISTTSDECPGKNDCPFGNVCFAEKAKAKAKISNVVVVNHAVLATDLAVKANQRDAGVPEHAVTGLLPHFSGVVVDEAHEMEEFVTNALGGEVTSGSYHRLGTQVANFLSDRDALNKIDILTSNLFNVVQKALDTRQDKRSKTVQMSDNVLASLHRGAEQGIDGPQDARGERTDHR